MWIYYLIIGTAFLTALAWKLFHFYLRETSNPEKQKMDIFSLKHKNAVISGEFFPTGEEALKNKLMNGKTNVLPQMSADTDILICGKFPDWNLVQEAKFRAIKVVFIDKTSDLFTGSISVEQGSFEGEPSYISKVPLGI